MEGENFLTIRHIFQIPITSSNSVCAPHLTRGWRGLHIPGW